MNLKNIWVMAIFFALVSPSAFADFSVDELVDATKVGLKDFVAANPGHLEHFVGYKAWKSQGDAKLKVYVTHDGMNMEFNYVCHKHDTEIECHAQ